MNICEPVAGEAMLSCCHHRHHRGENSTTHKEHTEDRHDEQKDSKQEGRGKNRVSMIKHTASTSPACRYISSGNHVAGVCAAQVEFHSELSLLAIPPRGVSTPVSPRKKRPLHFAFDLEYRIISARKHPRHATPQPAFIVARPLRNQSLQGSTDLTTST